MSKRSLGGPRLSADPQHKVGPDFMPISRPLLNPRSVLLGPVLLIFILLPLAFYSNLRNRIGLDNRNNDTSSGKDTGGILESLIKEKSTFTEAFSDAPSRQSLFQSLSQRSVRVPLSKTGTFEEATITIFGATEYYSGKYELPLADWLLDDNVRRALQETIDKGTVSLKAVATEWETFRDASLNFKRLLATPLQQVLTCERRTFSAGLAQGTFTGDGLLGIAIVFKRHTAAIEILHQWRKQSLEIIPKLPDEVAATVMNGLIIDYVGHESDTDRASNKAGRQIRKVTRLGENVASGPTDLKWGHPVHIYDIDPTTLKADFYTTFAPKLIPGTSKFRDPPLAEKIAKGRKVLLRYESMPLATHETTMAQLREIEDRLHACITELDPGFAPILQDLKIWSPEETLERTIQSAR